MTRPFYQLTDCPYCGKRITAETAFGRWIRNNPLLESSEGFSVVDQDYWVHRFKVYGKRSFQLIMGIEIKTRNSSMIEAARDTLHLVNQIMRNRRQTPTKEIKWQAGNAPIKAVSIKNRKKIFIRIYGVHLLQFSGLGPEDSTTIRWDGKNINEETLTSLLRFDLDPDTLRPIDLRSHHSPGLSMQVSLF
jgi:hypothetical protein